MTLQGEARASDEPQAPDEGAVASESVPPATEEVHLPEPSYLPVAVAFGITIALVGIVITFVLCIIGAVIALIAIVKWIRLTREEMAELPLDR